MMNKIGRNHVFCITTDNKTDVCAILEAYSDELIDMFYHPSGIYTIYLKFSDYGRKLRMVEWCMEHKVGCICKEGSIRND